MGACEKLYEGQRCYLCHELNLNAADDAAHSYAMDLGNARSALQLVPVLPDVFVETETVERLLQLLSVHLDALCAAVAKKRPVNECVRWADSRDDAETQVCAHYAVYK